MFIIEKEGQRYVGDKDGNVQKDDKGNPVVYDPQKHKETSVSDLELEALAKTNPHVARVLQEKQEAEKKAKELADAEEAKRQEDARKNGEWQKLAEENSAKLKAAEDERTKLSVIVQKDKETIQGLLDQVLETIPKERQSLIPADYSPRKKLEYIMSNAAALGVEPVIKTKGSEVPPHNNPPNLTEEAKLIAEIDGLMKKANKTRSEQTLLWEKTKALKELRAPKK